MAGTGSQSPQQAAAAASLAAAESNLAAMPVKADAALAAAKDALAAFRGLQDAQGTADCISIIGKILRHRGQLAEAESLVKEELARLEAAGDGSSLALAKLRLSAAEILTFSGHVGDGGRFSEAQDSVEKALIAAQAAADTDLIGSAMLTRVNLLIMQAEAADDTARKRAIEAAEEALGYSQQKQDKKGEAQACHCLAQARSLGGAEHAAGAMEATLEAVRLRRELKEPLALAVELQSAGRQYLRRRRPDEALPLATEAATIYRDLAMGGGQEASALEVVVTAHLEMGQPGEAETIATDALGRFRAGQDLKGEAAMLENLIFIHLMANEIERALTLAAEARAAAAQLGNKEQEARVLQLVASLSLQQSKFAGAVQSAKDAAELSQPQEDAAALDKLVDVQIAAQKQEEASQKAKASADAFHSRGDVSGEVAALLAACSVYVSQGELQMASTSMQQVKQLLSGIGDPVATAKAIRRMARVYIEMNMFGQALIELHEAVRLLDTAECPDRHGLVATLLLTAEAQTNEVMSRLDGSQALEAKSPAFAGAYLQARSLARRAVTLARELQDLQLIGAGVLFSAQLNMLAMRISDALEMANEAAIQFRLAGNIFGEVEAMVLRANAHLLGNRPEKASEVAKEALLLSRRCGSQQGEALCADVLERISSFKPASSQEEKLAAELSKTVRQPSAFVVEEPEASEADVRNFQAAAANTRQLSQEIVRSLVSRVGMHMSQELPTLHGNNSKYFLDGFSRDLPLLSSQTPRRLVTDSSILATSAYLRSRRS